MKKSVLTIASLFFCFALCTSSWAAETAGPRVVVSIKPIHSLVAGVMQGVAEPQLIIQGGGSPHGYVLRPSEARMLANADLVIWVGHSLESFLVKPLATLAPRTHQLELTESLEDQLLPLRDGGSWDAHAHELTSDAPSPGLGEPHKHEEHELNPHLWLSPLLAKQIVVETAMALSAIDPQHRDTYQQNAEQLQQRLDDLHRQLSNKLAPVKDVPYVVFHDAYQYFENVYSLNAVGSISVNAERKPGVKWIGEIRDKIKAMNVRCVFSEPQFEPRMVATIIEGTGARRGVLDPLGAELPSGPDNYFQLLNNLADNLLAGLTR